MLYAILMILWEEKKSALYIFFKQRLKSIVTKRTNGEVSNPGSKNIYHIMCGFDQTVMLKSSF